MSTRPTESEILADHVVHVIGIASGLVGVVALLGWAVVNLPVQTTVALAIYGAGLMAMLCCSGAYHMLPAPAWKPILRRLDHAAIFVKIAGTYTPFALVKMGGTAGLSLLAAVWIVALLGVAAKLLLAARWDGLAVAVYLLLGWSGVAALQPLAASIAPGALVLLAAGGVIYSLGVVFYLWNGLRYQNAIWHAFVLAGTACHFGAVSIAVAH